MMNQHAVNCRWCGDKPGGCLYCIDQLADSDQEKLLMIDSAIQRGEVHVLAIRTTQEVLLRQVVRKKTAVSHQPSPARQCVDHVWAYDRDNLKRRRCIKPGCSACQVFRFLPADPNRTGEWVDDNNAIVKALKSPKRKARK